MRPYINQPHTMMRDISAQLTRLLAAKSQQAEIIGHPGEKGVGNEQALRDLLRTVLPHRFGVGKGKIISRSGEQSKHIDVIIYDALQCPVLFTDEAENQIIPVDGVYAAIQVKTTIRKRELGDAFDNLASVYSLSPRTNISADSLVIRCAPLLNIFAFKSAMSLDAMVKSFVALSKQYPATMSNIIYNEQAFVTKQYHNRHDYYMVHGVCVLSMGEVTYGLAGIPLIREYGEHTLAMFILGLVHNCSRMNLPNFELFYYMNSLMVQEWHGKEIHRDFEEP